VVVETLKKTDPGRKCFRMIGGVMIERTVKEILPDLEEHRSNINEALKTLLSQYQAKVSRNLTSNPHQSALAHGLN
jgi:prefoldin subunit 2